MGIVEGITASPITSGIAAVTIAATAGILVYEYKRRRRASDEVDDWYTEALGLVGQLPHAGYQTTTFQDRIDADAIESGLSELAGQLRRHADEAPDGLKMQDRVKLTYLSAFTSGLINLSGQADQMEPDEFFENLQEHAREMHTGAHDMNDVNDLLEDLNLNALADEMEDAIGEDVPINDEAAADFLDFFSEESLEEGQPTTIDEALEMPVDSMNEFIEDDGFWEGFLDSMTHKYTRLILVEVSNDVYRSLEKRKSQV